MMKIKKLFAVITAAVMSASLLTACGGKNEEQAVSESNEAVSETEPENSFTLPEMSPMRDIPSTELVKEMSVGWNLGNTLDSFIDNYTGTETVERWETAWGQPVTTKAMIDMVKGQGFNVLRLPVTWTGKFGEAPDYTIREDWLARVKEIVDYAIEDDMFVILNMHHEDWNMPTDENAAAAEEICRKLWAQIADYFKDYNEKLIFEGMNEPRLKDTPLEWTGGDAASRAVINQWNAAFIETVRASGGNNPKRHLMIPPYAASSADTPLSELILPDDDKVIVSVHAYLPYLFALADNKQGTKEWSVDNAADTKDIDHLMELLNELFIKNGRAVIIGEFGTRNRMNTDPRAECARYYVSKAAELGIPCVWWDNNAFIGAGENFGLFDRKTFEWRYPAIITALMEARGKVGE